MKKYAILFVSILFSIFILAGCGDAVQDDLLNYVNKETPKLADEEAKIINRYASVTGANYTDDVTLYDALVDEVIPQYTDYIKKLEKIKIESKELQTIHDNYIDATKIQEDAFETIKVAIEKQDAGLIQEANQKLDKAHEMMADYQKDLDKLADEHDVDLKKKEKK